MRWDDWFRWFQVYTCQLDAIQTCAFINHCTAERPSKNSNLIPPRKCCARTEIQTVPVKAASAALVNNSRVGDGTKHASRQGALEVDGWSGRTVAMTHSDPCVGSGVQLPGATLGTTHTPPLQIRG